MFKEIRRRLEGAKVRREIDEQLEPLRAEANRLAASYRQERARHGQRTDAIAREMMGDKKNCRLYLNLRRQCEKDGLRSTLQILNFNHTSGDVQHISSCPFSKK